MARTVAEVITSAKNTLNDADLARYTEPELIGFVVDALQGMRNMRPDIFVGQLNTAIGTLTSASVLPVEEMYFRPLVDYVIARAETKDAEHVVSARAELMMKLAGGFLA